MDWIAGNFRLLASFLIWQCIFSFLSPIWKYLGEAFVPEFSLVLNILREGLGFVEAGRPFQSRNVQGMKLLLYETVLQKGSLKLSSDIFVVVDYNCEYFLCMVGSCHTYSPELNHLLFHRVKSTFVSLFFYKGVPSQVHYII